MQSISKLKSSKNLKVTFTGRSRTLAAVAWSAFTPLNTSVRDCATKWLQPLASAPLISTNTLIAQYYIPVTSRSR